MGKRKRPDEPVEEENTPHKKHDETKSAKKKRRKQLEEVEMEKAIVNTPTSEKSDETKSEKKKRRKKLKEVEVEKAIVNTPTSKKHDKTKSEKKKQLEETTNLESTPKPKKRHQHLDESLQKKKKKLKLGNEVKVEKVMVNTPTNKKSVETKSEKKKRGKQLKEVREENVMVKTPSVKKTDKTKSEKKKQRKHLEEVEVEKALVNTPNNKSDETQSGKKKQRKQLKEVEVEKALVNTPNNKSDETQSGKKKRRKQLEKVEVEKALVNTPNNKSDETQSGKKKQRKQLEKVEEKKAMVKTPTSKKSDDTKSSKKKRQKQLEEVEEAKAVNNKSAKKKTAVTKSVKNKRRLQQEEDDAPNGRSAKKKRRIEAKEVEVEKSTANKPTNGKTDKTKRAEKKRQELLLKEIEVKKAMVSPHDDSDTKSAKRKRQLQTKKIASMEKATDGTPQQTEATNTLNGKIPFLSRSAKKRLKKRQMKQQKENNGKLERRLEKRLENGEETNSVDDLKCEAFTGETIHKLKEQWKEKNKLRKSIMQYAKLYLYEEFASSKDPRETSKPIKLQDIQDLIQFTVLMGTFSNIPRIRFCKIVRVTKIPKVVVIVVNGVTEKLFQKNRECFPHLMSHYSVTGNVEEPATRGCLLKKLYFVHISSAQTNKRELMNKKKEKPAAEPEKEIKPVVEIKKPVRDKNIPGKLCFVMSQAEMAKWRYPSPNDEKFIHTNYSVTVTEDSPLISVDCEMCVTRAGSELTRVSLVDEEYQVLYDSLVKPRNPILNYVTQFSGITKKLLDPVTKRIEDIQKDIIALLPLDAILVGQSLENDLRAMKLYHPHVIDSSTLFTGHYRLALRKLTKQYLNWEIQTGTGGHDSIEDSVAALKLVQLKVNGGKGITGGLGVKKVVPEKISPPKEPEVPKVPEVPKEPKVPKKTEELNIPVECMFMASHSIGKVNMIVDCEYRASKFFRYPVGVLPCNSDKEAVQLAVERIPTSDFVSVQFYDYEKMTKWFLYTETESKEELRLQDKRVEEIYQTLPVGSMFVVIMGDFTVNEPTPSPDGLGGRLFTGFKV